MFSTHYIQTHQGIEISFAQNSQGLLGFKKRSEKISMREWSNSANAAATLALAEIYQFSDIYPDDFEEDHGTITFGWNLLSNLSNNTLKSLGLPENPGFEFSLSMEGSLLTKSFSIRPVWGSTSNPKRVTRNGAMLEDKSSEQKYIIPDPIFSILEIIDNYSTNGSDALSERMGLCAEIIAKVDPQKDEVESDITTEENVIKLTGALANFKVKTAKSLSLNVTQRPDGFHSTPVLFGSLEADSSLKPSEKHSLLTTRERNEFEHNKNSGFLKNKQAKRTYLLADGEYLLIDENLFPALQHVKEISNSSEEVRRDFATNPAKSLTNVYRKILAQKQLPELDEALEEEEIEFLINTIFVETQEFSERVTGLGLWVPPVLPYIKQDPNSWEPEEFGLFFGETFIPLAPEDINPLKKAVKKAIDEGKTDTIFNGKKIPVNEETLVAIQKLKGIIEPEKIKGPKPNPKQPEVLIIKENFDDLTFERQLQKRQRFEKNSVTNKVSSDLMSHQIVSLDWQINAYLSGLPGVLNADDQGLGKTLQTIAFLSWLQENMRKGPDLSKKPILVVAPTSLLKNWGNEVVDHMTSEFGLGEKIDAFGSSLKNLKIVESDEKVKLDLGVGPDVRPDSRICWILTTYTTLKEHQIEFAKIDFAAVVFDEIQAIKNVSTLSHRAASSLKSDFCIGLTGTPVENAISDLWAIIDTLSPGYLGSLKDFVERYNEASIEDYKLLNSRLFENSYNSNDSNTPPIAIRRMKSDTIADLPDKNYRLHTEIMPPSQEIAYDSAFVEIANATRGRVLKVLHRLRGVSLFPGIIDQLSEDENALERLSKESARFKSTIVILDQIKDRGEKALIFLESHEMQYALRSLLEKKYQLKEIPIINGQVMAFRRGNIVEDFQSKLGNGEFDLLILSPKAAGVGLTLTAATNIIHLSRWWNPAIEEQCNDRIYRIGQTEDVTIHIPISVHSKYQTQSFDCILNNIMLRKRKLFREVLMPAENLNRDQSTLFDELTGSSDFNIRDIDNLDWKAFEQWVGKKASDLGDWEVSMTPRTGDGGLDIYLKHVERKNVVLVQCKHTTRDEKYLGVSPVHEIVHAAGRYETGKNYQSVVITNAEGFVKEAMKIAAENNVTLIDRQRLALWPAHIV